MTLWKFAYGLVLTLVIVGMWSWWSEASWGVILLRVVVSAVAVQLGYFAYVLFMVGKARKVEPASPARDAVSRDGPNVDRAKG